MLQIAWRLISLMVTGCIACIGLAVLAGPYLPVGWELLYGLQNSPVTGWEVHILNVDRRLTAQLFEGVPITSIPVVSPDRRFVAWSGPSMQLHLLDLTTSRTQILDSSNSFLWPSWSADSRKLAYNSGGSLYLMHIDEQGNPRTPVEISSGNSSNENRAPVWSPDDHMLAFVNNRRSGYSEDHEVYILHLETGEVRNLSNHRTGTDRRPVWSPDGRSLAFASNRDGSPEIYIVDVDGNNLHRLNPHPATDVAPVWSPDSTRIAYLSYLGVGLYGLYVQDVADGGRLLGPLEVSLPGVAGPRWSPDGQRLAFVSAHDGQIYVVNSDGSDLTQLTDSKGFKVTLP